MTSSTDAYVLRGDGAQAAPLVGAGQLTTGAWTRLADATVAGDVVTETALDSLAERTRAAATAQGYAVGWAQGRRDAERELESRRASLQAEHDQTLAAARQRLDAAARSVAEVAAALEAEADRHRHAMDETATTLALELVETLVASHLIAEGPGAVAVRKALAEAAIPGIEEIRLSRTDATVEAVDALRAQGWRVVIDEALQPGDVMAHRAAGAIDLRLSAALHRIREALA